MNVPQKRFKGFSDQWEIKELSKVCEFTSSKRIFLSDYTAEGIPFLRGKEISELQLGILPKDLLHIPFSYYNEIKEKYGVPKKNDILITSVGTLGNTYIIKDSDKFYFKDGNLIWIKNITENASFFNISISYNKKKVLDSAIGSSQKALTMVSLKKIKFAFPSIEEQKKISTFFSIIDKKLDSLKKKKQLLEQYKKGVMQKIFSQELRFKDDEGKDFPEWEEKKLGEVTYKTDLKNKKSVKYPIYSINNVNGFVPQNEQFDGLDSNDRGYDISLYKIIEHDTFAYNPARINVGSLGYYGGNEKVIVSSLYVCFKSTAELNNSFLRHFFKSDYFNQEVLRKGEGGVRIYLFFENFSEISISYPTSLQEQQKIADFLTALDDKIALVEQQINKTELWKKGLLQQMFV